MWKSLSVTAVLLLKVFDVVYNFAIALEYSAAPVNAIFSEKLLEFKTALVQLSMNTAPPSIAQFD